MEPTPYGMEDVLDRLVPQLVGRGRDGEVCRFGRKDGAHPVLEVVGQRHSGKTLLLDSLYTAYKPWVAVARADCGDPRLGEPSLRAGADELENSHVSPLTSLLYLLSHKLGLGPRRIRFRRLSVGLVVVSAWRPEDEGLAPAELRRAQDEVDAVLASELADWQARRRALERWLDVVGRLAAALVPVFPEAEAAQPLLEVAREQLRARPGRGALRWWGDQLDAFQGDPAQRLFASVWDFRRGGVSRAQAEARLVRAFVEDVCDQYGLRRRLDRAAKPLLLLDNAHAPLGERFLGPLTERFAAVGAEPGRPVVVAASLGGTADPAGPVRDVAALPPGLARVRLALAPLTGLQIRSMLQVVPRYPAGLPVLVERFSGGRSGCARLLVEESVRLRGTGGAVGGRALLDATAGRLLERLLPHREARERLVLLSATDDEPSAVRLWRALFPDEDAAARVEQALAHLRAQRLDRDRATRILLLHLLGRDERRERVHLLLRSLHDPHRLDEYADGHPDAYLFHTLALGRTEVVVHALHRRFASTPPRDWLESLNSLCAAPRSGVPAGTSGARETPVPGCPACADPARPDRVHRAIRRLVATVWRLSDPCHCLPGEDDLDAVRADLEILHQARDEEDTTYRRAARQWSAQLREQAQAPDLRLTGPTGPEGPDGTRGGARHGEGGGAGDHPGPRPHGQGGVW
ncbi:hypothetical protein NX801_07690 [Streptomyces sp. LP05-1]|uniref:ATP-binding protein n=1 Tax=Streptomyces pyxinae TaxID=2970734 RepID=A0ABT2CDQ7_9ACTN|nr:hypothetical protein [Streptomyces sp. LP05-1]MCS0635542.1 hypothetical protein [Streptomyces sp. LP05-1]